MTFLIVVSVFSLSRTFLSLSTTEAFTVLLQVAKILWLTTCPSYSRLPARTWPSQHSVKLNLSFSSVLGLPEDLGEKRKKANTKHVRGYP